MPAHDPLNCLSHVELFKDLPLDLRKQLVKISSHRKYYKKGSMIRQPGDGQDGVLSLDIGKAKVFNITPSGKEMVLGILRQGDIEGQAYLFQKDESENFIQATEDTWICSMNYNDFQGLLKKSPDLALRLLNNFGQRLVKTQQNTLRVNAMGAQARLYDYLLDYSKEIGKNSFNLPLKKKDLASMLGLTPETLSRELKKLKVAKKIDYAGKQITLL